MNQKSHTGGNGARLRRLKEATGTGPQATGFCELSVGLISGVLNILLGNRRQIGNLGVWVCGHFLPFGIGGIFGTLGWCPINKFWPKCK